MGIGGDGWTSLLDWNGMRKGREGYTSTHTPQAMTSNQFSFSYLLRQHGSRTIFMTIITILQRHKDTQNRAHKSFIRKYPSKFVLTKHLLCTTRSMTPSHIHTLQNVLRVFATSAQSSTLNEWWAMICNHDWWRGMRFTPRYLREFETPNTPHRPIRSIIGISFLISLIPVYRSLDVILMQFQLDMILSHWIPLFFWYLFLLLFNLFCLWMGWHELLRYSFCI